MDYVIARDREDARTLVWTAQYNAVEVHPWLSRVDHPDPPDWAVLDLDLHGAAGRGPGRLPPAGPAARRLRERLAAAHGLEVYPKLSGQSGVHLLLPLEPVHSFDDVRAFLVAEANAAVADAHPDLLTDGLRDRRPRRARPDRLRPERARAAHRSPLQRAPPPGAPVSAPVTWEELDDPRLRADRWTVRTIGGRLAAAGDVLAPALKRRQRLPPA